MPNGRQRVAMLMLHDTPRDDEARHELARVLDGAEVTDPDETGVFEIEVDAGDEEQALRTVWNGIAATGADDHIVFLEHPELPEHWRSRAGSPKVS
jgi:hypothetical protein